MSKIGIITLNGYFNYGNRLQNYALITYLQKLKEDVSVDNIWYTRDDSLFNKKMKTRTFLRKYIFNRHGFRDDMNNRLYLYEDIREYNLKKFSDRYTNTVRTNNLKELSDKYDMFIAGSDQIWHPEWVDGYAEFLQFTSKEKRASYAASIGARSIPKEKRALYKDYFNGMKYISLRENEGANIVRDLTGRQPLVHLDPTMLLTKDEWETVAQRPTWYKKEEKYIFTFFLAKQDESMLKAIHKFAEENDYKVVNILDNGNFEYYTSSPEEFLYAIKHAGLVLTDSFHCTVFSIIFEVPFLNYKRVDMDMNCRIETLLSMANLAARAVDSNHTLTMEDTKSIDYTYTKQVIKAKREEAKQYLEQVLSVKGE